MSRRTALLLPALAFLVTAAVALVGFRFHLSTDVVSYLSIADHLVAGREGAVNGYWSPLLSWLLAVPRALGVGAVAAANGTALLIAAGLLAVLGWACGRAGVPRLPATIVLTAVAPVLVYGALTEVTPDLLVAIPVVVAVTLAARPLDGRGAAAVGALIAAAYLAKLYALPALALAVPVLVLARTRPLRLGVRRAAVVAATAALVAAPWVAVLSADEGRLIFGTAAGENAGDLTSGAWGSPIFWAGFLEPPTPGATSSWEDPVAATAGVEAPPQEDLAAGEPALPGAGLLANVAPGLVRTGGFLTRWWPLFLLVAVAIGGREPADDDRRAITDAHLLAAAVWLSGLLLLLVRERYLWTSAVLLVPTAGHGAAFLLEEVRDRWSRTVAGLVAVVLALSLVPTTAARLVARWDVGRPVAELATALRPHVDAGQDVASLDGWHESVVLCFRLGCRYHGVPRPVADADEVAAELREHGIDRLLVYDDGDVIPADATAVTEATLPSDPPVDVRVLAP